MPKLSVYIPDDLWVQAQALQPDEGASQVLQAALREKVERTEARPYAVLTDQIRAKQLVVAGEVEGRLRTAYQAGFDMGLEFTKLLPWDALHAFASLGWDLDEMRALMHVEEFP